MIKIKFLSTLIIVLIFISQRSYSQNDDPDISSIINQTLSYPELKDYEVISFLLELKPGFSNEESHRHGGDLFGYVLEGTIELTMENDTPVQYKVGEMFHEMHMQLHKKYHNPSNTVSAKILMIQIVKKGTNRFQSVEHN